MTDDSDHIDLSAGWVKLWRKTLDSWVFQDEKRLKVWIYCLMRASHKRRWIRLKTGRGYTDVELQPGQLIYGRGAWAKRLGISQGTIERIVTALQKHGNCDRQANTHYSVITLCNYEAYASPSQASGQASGQPTDNQRTTNGQPTDTIENDDNSYRSETVVETKARKPAKPGIDQALRTLIDGWNELGPAIVKPGNGAKKSPPAQAVTAGWARAKANGEQSEPFSDIPAVLAAIREASYCHTQGWFTLPWLFGKNKNGEFNINKLMNGAHDGSQTGQQQSRDNSLGAPDGTPGKGYL